MTEEENKWEPVYDRMKEYQDTLLEGQEKIDLSIPVEFVPLPEEKVKEPMTLFLNGTEYGDYVKKSMMDRWTKGSMTSYRELPYVICSQCGKEYHYIPTPFVCQCGTGEYLTRINSLADEIRLRAKMGTIPPQTIKDEIERKDLQELLRRPLEFVNKETGLPPTEEEKKEIASYFDKPIKSNEGYILNVYNRIPIWVDDLDTILRRERSPIIWSVRHPNKKMPERWDKCKKIWEKNVRTYLENQSRIWGDD